MTVDGRRWRQAIQIEIAIEIEIEIVLPCLRDRKIGIETAFDPDLDGIASAS